MAEHLEELQAKKYLEHLLSVEPVQWQWFAARQCFEVGDAAARPRVYFDVEVRYGAYLLAVDLEVDGAKVNSHVLPVAKQPPADHDELLRHLTEVEHPHLLVVLLVRLLRNRIVMSTTARPEHLRVRIDNYLTVLKQKVMVDLPHNVQERMTMLKIERNANRVRPRSRRG